MTFKEFMHTSNPHLDNLARESEIQRTADEEAAYEDRHDNTKLVLSSYDCRKINVARNIQDGFFEYYKEQDDGRTKESALMSQIALLLLNYGPKVDEALNNNEVELFDGFISETEV